MLHDLYMNGFFKVFKLFDRYKKSSELEKAISEDIGSVLDGIVTKKQFPSLLGILIKGKIPVVFVWVILSGKEKEHWLFM